MTIDAGKLDRTMTLMSATTSRDAAGGVVTSSWSTVATVAAQRLQVRFTDLRSSSGIETVPDAKFLIRWRPDVVNTMRVQVDGCTYTITSIDQPDRRQSLILTLQGV